VPVVPWSMASSMPVGTLGSRTVDWELTGRVRTRRGEIAYRSMGDGPPVVLVHGTPSRSIVWRQVVPVSHLALVDAVVLAPWIPRAPSVW